MKIAVKCGLYLMCIKLHSNSLTQNLNLNENSVDVNVSKIKY